MVLHLRYPNAHTHWFSSLLLHHFVEVKDDYFHEVMTHVLLERFIVHRPHPWRALVTVIELLRNQKYEFWSKESVRVALHGDGSGTWLTPESKIQCLLPRDYEKSHIPGP